MIANARGAKSVHWLMDMYPELAVALGELRPGFVPKMIEKGMRWGYKKADLVVGLDSDMSEHLNRVYGVNAEVIRPWINERALASASAADAQPDDAWTWIYSGNLGRAHEWETILRAQALLEARGLPIRLLFQGGGPSREPAQALAMQLHLKKCEWKEYVDESELPRSLLRCRVLIATQKPDTRGLLWPSKLALAMHLPRPILWIGTADGAVAALLKQSGRAGVFGCGENEAVAEWIAGQFHGDAASGQAVDGRAERANSLAKWEELLYSRGILVTTRR